METYELDGERYYYIDGQWLTTAYLDAPADKIGRLNKLLLERVEINVKGKSVDELLSIMDGAKRSGNTALAVKAGRWVLDAANKDEVSLLLPRIASTFRKLGRPQDAIDVTLENLDLCGKAVASPMLYTTLAAAYCDIGDIDLSRHYADQASELFGGDSSPELIELYRRLHSLGGVPVAKKGDEQSSVLLDDTPGETAEGRDGENPSERRCIRCNEKMIEHCFVARQGESSGRLVLKKKKGITSRTLGYIRAAVCPVCCEISFYLNPEEDNLDVPGGLLSYFVSDDDAGGVLL